MPTLCDECGELGDDVQHVSIAWPGSQPHFVAVEGGFLTNPKANGLGVTLHLHHGCEDAAIKRLEQQRGAIE